MIAFMTIIYVALVVLVFKVFKVKPSRWPIALLATIGILMLGIIVVLWTIAAPISTRAVVSRYVIQIVPIVKGQVISIPAEPNVPLKKGEVLYEIDPTPYEYQVNLSTAQLAAAKSNVTQLEASVRVAKATVEKAEADVATNQAASDVALAINKENPQAISKLKMVQAKESLAAAQAALAQAKASEDQAKAALVSAQDNIGVVESQLETAEFNLSGCTVKAPTDGFVTDWQIREGTYVVAMPFAAAGTFIDTEETMVVASLPAQMLLHVQPGNPVELAFKSQPGKLFRGKVENILQATGEGQFTTGGKLPSAAQLGSPGILAVKISLDEGQPIDELEMGAAGSVAIYTDWGKPFAMISKVTIRLKKWAYFLPLP
ncbi:HlyD family secretion protein [Bythopirellula polymerisocia]|uniref:Inner membrane protein YiaV n=1 Tax=Bythopirellula polymerisocia TaxID=2528003 RepID=A0A5C6D096_9BACT|nr:efflux RND transporter periplasmic adaptor subunit [Bythopirellula polymerisocia]TWU29595.1 Inner membrane protein YiaV precursor [Bythopirellula polymerisocia]